MSINSLSSWVVLGGCGLVVVGFGIVGGGCRWYRVSTGCCRCFWLFFSRLFLDSSREILGDFPSICSCYGPFFHLLQPIVAHHSKSLPTPDRDPSGIGWDSKLKCWSILICSTDKVTNLLFLHWHWTRPFPSIAVKWFPPPTWKTSAAWPITGRADFFFSQWKLLKLM